MPILDLGVPMLHRMKTVLVVEDEAPIAAAVAARLRSEGFRVEVAATGPLGVELCRRLRPALVVLDLMLPGLDGLEVLRQVQRDRLLYFLGCRPGVVFTREQLLAEVWGWPDGSGTRGSGTRTVDSHVQALRRKLGAGVVRTVHGIGYAAPEGAR
jgi:DNA-binding response OmpR family regulator